MLTSSEQLRYSRQLLLKGFEQENQIQLKNATVLIIGIGGLGNPASMYLAGAGIGRLILADGDKVDITNLQRQVMFNNSHVGQNKAETAQQYLTTLNPDIDIEAVDEMLDAETINYYVEEADIVLDCTDNLSTRYLINEACVQYKTPLVSGAAIRFEGQLFTVDPSQENYPCYQCFYPKDKGEPTMNCSTAGVLGPVLGIIGSMQALEAIKLLIGRDVTNNQIALFDGLANQWQYFAIKKRDGCICQK